MSGALTLGPGGGPRPASAQVPDGPPLAGTASKQPIAPATASGSAPIAPPPSDLGHLLSFLGEQGAPELGLPAEVFDSDELTLVLMEWGSKINRARAETLRVGINNKRAAIEGATRDAIKKIGDHFKKLEAAAAKAKANKILNWVAKTATFLAASVMLAVAVAATVSTGGAAAPLLVFAIMAFVAAAGAFATQCSAESGGPALTLGAGLGKLCEACGADPKIGEIIGAALTGDLGPAAAAIAVEVFNADPQQAMIVGVVFTVASALVMMAASANIAGGLQASTGALQTAMRINATVQNANMIVGGTTMVASGTVQVQTAQIMYEADMIKADQKEVEAAIVRLQQMLAQDTEVMKETVERAAEIDQILSNIIASWGQGRAQVISGMSSRNAV